LRRSLNATVRVVTSNVGDQICNDGHLDQRCGKHRSDHCRGGKVNEQVALLA
jgi:hypothetical protein